MPSVDQVQCPIEGEMSPEELKQYFSEVGTSAEALARDAATLRSWINAEPHLPNVTGDLDRWLETVLLASKNSMEKAKTRIDNYFANHGALNGDMFALPPPPADIAVADTSEFMLAGPIPRVIPGGYVVVLEKHVMPPDGNYGRFDMNNQFRRSVLFADALLGECKKIRGLILCIDQSNMNMAVGSTFLSCLSGFRRGTHIVQDALPLRIHAVHLINATAPTLQKMLLNAVTPLLKGKLAQRIHIHDGYKTLHEHIPPAYLPAEYGGTDTYTMESISSSVTNYILSKRDWFSSRKWMQTYEDRRLVKKSTSSDLGMEGSFRKLCVD